MTFHTSLTLWASSTALLFSIGASVVATLLWRQSLKNSAARLRQQLSDQQEQLDELARQLKQLRSRYTMQNLRLAREARPPETTAEIDPEREAAETRRNLADQLARGALKVNQ